MDNSLQITPSSLKGSLRIPSSKSHTLRAILFGALARGESVIEHYLPSPDTDAMIEAVRQLGASIAIEKERLLIRGVAGKPKVPSDVIHCGNSGQVLRFIGAIAALLPQYTILTGDLSIRTQRPVKPLLDALHQLGAFATSSQGNDLAPLLIKGPFTRNKATLDGQDSQPVSGLLIAGAFAPHPTEIYVTNPGEKPWIDVTLSWFRKFKIPYTAHAYQFYRMEGSAQIDGFHYTVPGDFSTAAFPIGAALITGSTLTLENIDFDDVQGDKALIPLLEQMGARFEIDAPNKRLHVCKGTPLRGTRIDINDCIDALPILSVIGCFAEGKTEIFNGAIARKKESDRIYAIATELQKMGARVEEHPDGLTVYSSKLRGADLLSYADHRLALSLSVAALGATNSSTVSDVTCIAKTYPHFCRDFQSIGAHIFS